MAVQTKRINQHDNNNNMRPTRRDNDNSSCCYGGGVMIYYIWEPSHYGLETFATESEWLEAIEHYDFLGKFCDDGWSEEVWNVVAGKAPKERCEDDYCDEDYIEEQDYYEQYATHEVEEFLIKERPDDSEIDERGYDSEGTYFGDFTKICGYTFKEKAPQ